MSETTVAVLTPSGSGAVAVLEVRGPRAWPAIQCLFRTSAGRTLPDPPVGFKYGRFGDQSAEEIILATTGPERFELQCHGGPRVEAWLLELFLANNVRGGVRSPNGFAEQAVRLLPLARTTRTAAIMLDQVHGAYDRAARAIADGTVESERLADTMRRNANVGRHLLTPWTVAIAGLPNAGKSSLLNALTGFARSVVSSTPGTTRDAVTASVAFDGWPVDLIDTAGLRESADAIEAEGVGRARSAVESSDLLLWVVDATGQRPASVAQIAGPLEVPEDRVLFVFNKTDLAQVPEGELPTGVRVSATTGSGLAGLVGRIVNRLVSEPPAPGDPVPFTPEECDRWSPP